MLNPSQLPNPLQRQSYETNHSPWRMDVNFLFVGNKYISPLRQRSPPCRNTDLQKHVNSRGCDLGGRFPPSTSPQSCSPHRPEGSPTPTPSAPQPLGGGVGWETRRTGIIVGNCLSDLNGSSGGPKFRELSDTPPPPMVSAEVLILLFIPPVIKMAVLEGLAPKPSWGYAAPL